MSASQLPPPKTKNLENFAKEFADLLELALLLCDLPNGFIGLIDSDRYNLKAKAGDLPLQLSRNLPVIAQTLTTREPLLIPDLRLDPLFKHQPVILGSSEAQSFLGFPLIVDEKVVGTFCLMDSVPRGFSRRQIRILKIITQQICDQLDRERLQRELRVLKYSHAEPASKQHFV